MKNTGEGAVKQAWCTCMDGLGFSCSHVGALFWKIEYAVRNSMTGSSPTPKRSIKSGGGKENDFRWMKLRSGKTTRRTRSLNLNNLQGFHPLSPAPGTKVGEGTIAKDLKSIPEEATEEKHLDNSDNLDHPEDRGAAAPVPKAKETGDKFKLLKGRNGGFCDRLTSSSYNASNARNSSYKVELEVGGRNGNLSIGLYYPSTRQYQEIISYINISVHWRQVEDYFEPTYEIFQLVLHACVNNNISYIGLDNIDLLQLSKDGKYTKSCSVKQFSCGDNSCISIDKICDFREDCLNGQDESNITCDSLPLGAYCNFDSPDWCGWHNVKSGDLIKDDLDWKWHTGSTPTQDTGPMEDHTTGNGHYMYMHSSGGTFLETTVLESPVFDAPNEKLGQNCQVHFHYYMYGGYVSKLVLKLVPLNDDDLKPCEEKNRVILFDKFKDQGQKWHFAAVDIKNITKRFKLHFIGYIGFSKQSDIALDDISLSPSCFGGKKDFNITVTPKCMVSEWSDWTESDLKGVSYRIGNITRSSENEKCRKHGQVQYAKVYSFGSCGYHGPTGPTQFKCDSAYKSSSVKVKVISSGTLKGTQVWTVPENGTYG
ncbi:ALK [Mytilus edulis]|uniref:ALK n=1 Tax=Mytilus edulis TaxID=6550 RepID=A0A8S3PYK1_MYTED|nr:ALK [Mytilus edulis]